MLAELAAAAWLLWPVPSAGAASIHPVYPSDAGMILVDRRPGAWKKGYKKNSPFLVVGSRAAAILSVVKATSTWEAACKGKKHLTLPAYVLGGRDAGRIGDPIIAIFLKKRSAVDTRRAQFKRLGNQVNEDAYRDFLDSVKAITSKELTSGDFVIDPGDDYGRQLASQPNAEHQLHNFDFGAQLKLAGIQDAFFMVDRIQFSKTLRRCVRLFINGKAAGGCAPMPHQLMAETNLLEFVSYDPNGTGQPFLLAYTPKAPLWGHERWGFQVSRRGPKRFMMDALDPKCRERL